MGEIEMLGFKSEKEFEEWMEKNRRCLREIEDMEKEVSRKLEYDLKGV